jgi:hypothetical protein
MKQQSQYPPSDQFQIPLTLPSLVTGLTNAEIENRLVYRGSTNRSTHNVEHWLASRCSMIFALKPYPGTIARERGVQGDEVSEEQAA